MRQSGFKALAIIRCISHVGTEVPSHFLILGEGVEVVSSRAADDKYWQISAKAGETPAQPLITALYARVITI